MDQVTGDTRGPAIVALNVPVQTAVGDLAVASRHAAEADHQLTMLDDLRPACGFFQQALIAANDVRQDHLGPPKPQNPKFAEIKKIFNNEPTNR